MTTHIPSSWILLDSQSTIDVFQNMNLLSNIRQADGQMDIHCNAGVTSTNMVGDLGGYGTVWYHPQGIANILSLSHVRDCGYRVTYDSVSNVFCIHKHDGSCRVFKQSSRGLYYMDTNDDMQQSTLLVNTVEEKKSNYSKRDYNQAVLARRLQCIIGRPSLKSYLKIIDNNLIVNCPITRRDIISAEDIFGPDLGTLKGKTVRQTPLPVKLSFANVPDSIMARYHNVILGADIMFVNRIPFFVTISRHLQFGTVEALPNQQANMQSSKYMLSTSNVVFVLLTFLWMGSLNL
jgi:hypothetical protein